MARSNSKSDSIRNFILHQVGNHPGDISRVTVEQFKISRQSVSQYLRTLVREGLITATGNTRGRTYQVPLIIHETFTISITAATQEDAIWREKLLPLIRNLNQNVLAICQFGFTEMLNNVIDHSESESALVSLRRDAADIQIMVSDEGIGIFEKIQSEFGLEDARHALLELSKGKLTTDPESHTGESLFFTSLMFDKFSLMSGDLYYARESQKDGWLIESDNREPIEGTAVFMRIDVNSSRTMGEVFDQFASGDSDYSFSRTVVPIQLARHEGEELISRSQAKRIMARVDRFKEVLLDFQGVATIGQSFADEIFRVFHRQHPEILLSRINATPGIDRMISRVRENGRS